MVKVKLQEGLCVGVGLRVLLALRLSCMRGYAGGVMRRVGVRVRVRAKVKLHEG